jgi:hypothetical protein
MSPISLGLFLSKTQHQKDTNIVLWSERVLSAMDIV